ncbi:MAG: extracellular solute-binding protein [Holosporales bacterium]|jgi:putrescine transport system substrate-binding protein|nr:extracellular solute-binding protein [Holosporales bacterium]
MSKKFITYSLFAAFLIIVLRWYRSENTSVNVVNVCGWYGVIPREVFDDFEKETGIKVRYDFYDSNEALEAKLLAANSGYDVVFPSFLPYAARQLSMKLYAKLNHKLIPNIKNVDGIITSKFKENGGDTQFLIPLFWGTIGIAYNEEVISKLLPSETIDSYEILFNPSKVSKLFPYGVSFPEEYIDIIPQTKVFLQLNHNDNFIADTAACFHFLAKVRPYITKFSSTTMISDLLSGDICIAIGTSDNALKAMRAAKFVKKVIQFRLPKNNGLLWIDCACIPRKALNILNAHKLINFLLRPDIAARITNHSGILVNLPGGLYLINPEITSKKEICPSDPGVLNNLILTRFGMENAKSLIKSWTQYKMFAQFTDTNKGETK